jgi:hypothetical protein
MTWFTALSIGLVADVFVGILLALFVRADKRYQVEKLARLAVEGLYRPWVVDEPLPSWKPPARLANYR